MYRRGHQIAGVGCASLGAPCGSRLGETRNGTYYFPGLLHAATGPEAYSALISYAKKAREIAQGPNLPGATLSERYRETLIAIFNALRESRDAAQALDGPLLSWWEQVRTVPGIQVQLDAMAEDIAIANRVAAAMEEALREENARAHAAWQASYGDYGDFNQWLYNRTIGWLKERSTVAKETFVDPVTGAVTDAIDEAAKALAAAADKMAKADIFKWALPIGAVALVAYFALKR